MSKRLFIAINLPDFVREELAKWQVCLKELPFRWVKPEHFMQVVQGYGIQEVVFQDGELKQM